MSDPAFSNDGSETASQAPDGPLKHSEAQRGSASSLVVALLLVAVIVGLSLWYLIQPQPLLVQGEADATRIDIAARIDGRVANRPAERGASVGRGETLLEIDNPQLLTKLAETEAAARVAEADLVRVETGTRPETIAVRKAAVASAEANLKLAQQNYDRTKQLSERNFATMQHLDEMTATLDVARRSAEQARLSYTEAVNGYTPEERAVAKATLEKARSAVETLRAQVAELKVAAPIAGQVYQIGAELGEYVSPGVALLSIVDLGDVWLRFDLREDLVKGLKVGDRFAVKIPALGDKPVTVALRVIAPRGEYAGWRATRATGDFDLRTFEVRAYPVDPLPGLRPGMSAYGAWSGR